MLKKEAGLATRIAGKALVLLDYHKPMDFKEEEQQTVYVMILQSLSKYCRGYPCLGLPLWIDKRNDTGEWDDISSCPKETSRSILSSL